MPRRREGSVLPLEAKILLNLMNEERRQAQNGETPGLHGFGLAKILEEHGDSKKLIQYGTMYKALTRMEKEGWLKSRWEDPETSQAAPRPPRKLYTVTNAGADALAATANTSTEPMFTAKQKPRVRTTGP